jgi:hypothetical protein
MMLENVTMGKGGRDFQMVGSVKCPWCGRACWSWTGVCECGLCGVKWTKEGMETRRQAGVDYVNEDWDKIDMRWKPVPEGCLVVRKSS